jgi:hypothetical protein
MAKTYEVEVVADAAEVYSYLSEKMSHIEKVSEDVYTDEGIFIAVMFYEQFFMRVGNQASLLVLIESLGRERTRVKSVSCGTSKGMFIKIDLGAASAFAEEPMRHLRARYQVSNR